MPRFCCQCEDPNDALNSPVEFLNVQTPSGMSVTCVFVLMKGVIIMYRIVCTITNYSYLINLHRLKVLFRI